MNKKNIILLSGLLVFCLIVIGFGIWLATYSSSPQPVSAVPTPVSNSSKKNTTPDGESNYPNEKYQIDSVKNLDTPVEKKAHELAGNIIKLRTSLPYNGSSFSLRYTIDNNIYTATLSPSNKTAGQEELTQFLASFGLAESDISLVVQ